MPHLQSSSGVNEHHSLLTYLLTDSSSANDNICCLSSGINRHQTVQNGRFGKRLVVRV